MGLRPVVDAFHKLRGGRDAVAADETIDLSPQGNEGDEVDDPEQTEKKPASEKVRWRLDLFAPEKTSEERKAGTVFGDETVETLGDRRDAGNVLVEPERPSLAGRDRQCAKDGLGSRVDVPVRVDELHRLLALLTSQFGKTLRDSRVLERDVFDAFAVGLLPAQNPAAAEIAVTVEDHHGLGRR